MWLENIDSRYFGWKIFGMNILRLSRIWWSKRSSRLKQKAARAQLSVDNLSISILAS
jgi:hypothetical protein